MKKQKRTCIAYNGLLFLSMSLAVKNTLSQYGASLIYQKGGLVFFFFLIQINDIISEEHRMLFHSMYYSIKRNVLASSIEGSFCNEGNKNKEMQFHGCVLL